MRLFENQIGHCALIGMVHLKALPGTPWSSHGVDEILEFALKDAQLLVEGGVDALLVENMSDLPYLCGRVGSEIVSSMSLAVYEIRRQFSVPVGLQILAGANMEAMAVASCTGASFIRAEAFAYAHVADEGMMNASAAAVLRLRRNLGSSVKVWADVQKKHSSHAITSDLGMADLAHGFQFCGADALIVTGVATGSSASLKDVEAARYGGLPVIVGSGIDDGNVVEFSRVCDGLIVGSWIKEDGDWRAAVDIERVRCLRALMNE